MNSPFTDKPAIKCTKDITKSLPAITPSKKCFTDSKLVEEIARKRASREAWCVRRDKKEARRLRQKILSDSLELTKDKYDAAISRFKRGKGQKPTQILRNDIVEYDREIAALFDLKIEDEIKNEIIRPQASGIQKQKSKAKTHTNIEK